MLCLPPDIMHAIVDRMCPEAPWVALTLDKTLTEEKTLTDKTLTAGPAMNHPCVVVATDGAVKSDGRMGAAYVSLGDRLPARSFVVLGPPSTMRAELSALDQYLQW